MFLIGCEEGYLPHARTLDARATDGVPTSDGRGAADIEEERRLFYVGVTRAREHARASRAPIAACSAARPSPRTPSRFLLDVPPSSSRRSIVKDEAPTTAREAAAAAEAILAMLQRPRDAAGSRGGDRVPA